MPTDPHTQEKTRNLGLTAIIAGALLFLAAIVALRVHQPAVQVDTSKVSESDRWKYSAEGRASRLAEIRARETASATTYGWVDRKAGVVRLPLDRAAELTLRDLNAGQAR